MSSSAPLNGFTAAATILKWLRAANGQTEARVDLDQVREGLPGSPFGKGVRVIKPPMPSPVENCEGMLVCNPSDAAEWGLFVNPDAGPERRRFTIAHELGHFVLHRARKASFRCDKEAVHLGLDSSAVIEREADEFASNLLMPGDVLRDAIAKRHVDLHLLSDLAKAFEVSFEALCIRFIKYTDQRAAYSTDRGHRFQSDDGRRSMLIADSVAGDGGHLPLGIRVTGPMVAQLSAMDLEHMPGYPRGAAAPGG